MIMRKSVVSAVSLLALGLVFITTQAAHAQKGLYLGVKLAGTSVTFDDDDTFDKQSGGGLELDLGYNFSSRFGLFATLGGYSLKDNDATLGYFDLGPRFFLIPEGNVKPYLDVLLTGSAFAEEDSGIEYSLRGGGLSGGGGVQLYLSPRAAINLGLLFSRINYNEAKVENISVDDLDIKAWNSRLKVGMSFYF